jgi:hypothetical protein
VFGYALYHLLYKYAELISRASFTVRLIGRFFYSNRNLFAGASKSFHPNQNGLKPNFLFSNEYVSSTELVLERFVVFHGQLVSCKAPIDLLRWVLVPLIPWPRLTNLYLGINSAGISGTNIVSGPKSAPLDPKTTDCNRHKYELPRRSDILALVFRGFVWKSWHIHSS